MRTNHLTSEKADSHNFDTGCVKRSNLFEIFEDTIYVQISDNPYLKEQAHRLRYQVYCVEHPYEDPLSNPDGLEIDKYDSHATHCVLFHQPTAKFAGTARLILPLEHAPERSFPIQEVCSDPSLRHAHTFPVPLIGEISRFCVAKAFHQTVRTHRAGSGPQDRSGRAATGDQHLLRHIKLGLFQGLLRISLAEELLYWCCEMEPILLRLLARIGMHWQPIGPLVDHHGLRQPCIARISTLLQGVRDRDPDSWSVITGNGRYWSQLMALERTMSARCPVQDAPTLHLA